MASNIELEATARGGVGKGAARQARREGFVPGVVYGGNSDPETINIKQNVLLKLLKAGKFLSTLIKINIDGKEQTVICRAVQRDVVKDLPVHADFLRLSERSRIALMIPVEFVNEEEAPGIKKGDFPPSDQDFPPIGAVLDHLRTAPSQEPAAKTEPEQEKEPETSSDADTPTPAVALLSLFT